MIQRQNLTHECQVQKGTTSGRETLQGHIHKAEQGFFLPVLCMDFLLHWTQYSFIACLGHCSSCLSWQPSWAWSLKALQDIFALLVKSLRLLLFSSLHKLFCTRVVQEGGRSCGSIESQESIEVISELNFNISVFQTKFIQSKTKETFQIDSFAWIKAILGEQFIFFIN